MSDPASRKWQLTINNPLERGLDHAKIREILFTFPSICYFCLSDEKGLEEETYHTHVFLNLSPSNCRFSTLKSKFPSAHIEKALGTSQQNRDYVAKEGKWAEDAKGETSIPGTFEEWGEMPVEHQGKSKEADRILELIKDGATDLEILDSVPGALKIMDKVERARSLYRDAQFASTWRDVKVTYIFGKTGSGKTRSVMEAYGYGQVYRITDYKHPFDNYGGQDVIIFEEFRGGLKHGDMLNYLDGYPLLLPCRYFNRPACFTKVFIITNLPPDRQYENVDEESRRAFFRRIDKVREFVSQGKFPVKIVDYDSVDAYIHRYDWANGEPTEQLTL